MSRLGFASLDRPIREYIALTCLLFNFASCVANSEDAPNPLIVARKKERYVGTGISFDAMMRVIKKLATGGLLLQTLGDWEAGKATELLPTVQMVQMVTATTNLHVEVVKTPDLVILKDAEGKHLPVPDTQQTRKMQENLRVINAASAKFKWRFSHAGIEHELIPPDLAYHRSFNHGSFELGGRFYSLAEGLPEKKLHLRSTLTVNGHPTVELDFKSMQPRMLYHMGGHEAPEDCYAIDVPQLEKHPQAREIIKKAVLVALNCRADQNPPSALWSSLQRDGLWLPKDLKPSELLAQVKAAHPKIANSFCSGIGLSLQFRDAQIAERVLLAFDDAGKPCLAIHDSFVVAADDKDFAEDAMTAAYFAEMGAEPKITLKEKA